jgi:hypothetical protein
MNIIILLVAGSALLCTILTIFGKSIVNALPF